MRKSRIFGKCFDMGGSLHGLSKTDYSLAHATDHMTNKLDHQFTSFVCVAYIRSQMK